MRASRHKRFLRTVAVLVGWSLVVLRAPSMAAEYIARPDNYLAILKRLAPGDTLWLAPGTYRHGLPIHGLQGTEKAPIVISGIPSQDRPVFLARRGANTVSLIDAAHIVVRSLVLDGGNLIADGVKAEGHAEFAHHITLENLLIVNHGIDQSVVGISTKCPAWGWVIRGNVILGAGTGLYLGNSDGRAPFVSGLIEHNVVRDTIGYNLQIKHQIERPPLAGMPTGDSQTVIRHNVFSKANNASTGPMARPNLLVGHWPLEGPGANDRYLIYGNFFYDNPSGEPLFQGEGNVALYNNAFVNPSGSAILIQPHRGVPREIRVFNNTVVARDAGIIIRGVASGHQPVVAANAVFAGEPFLGLDGAGNLGLPYAEAAQHMRAPFAAPPQLDVSPRGVLRVSSVLLPEPLRRLPGAAADYDGHARGAEDVGAFAYRPRGRPLALEGGPDRSLHRAADR
jgi:hypothetical protein